MRALRSFIAVSLVAATLVAIAFRFLPRIQCNLEKGRINADIRDLLRFGVGDLRIARATRNAEACRRCTELYPQDYEMLILLGMNERALGHPEESLRAYRRALALNERPEIYGHMAVVELQQGNVAAAREHLLRAATFSVVFTALVDEPLRSEVYTAAMERHEQLRRNTKK